MYYKETSIFFSFFFSLGHSTVISFFSTYIKCKLLLFFCFLFFLLIHSSILNVPVLLQPLPNNTNEVCFEPFFFNFLLKTPPASILHCRFFFYYIKRFNGITSFYTSLYQSVDRSNYLFMIHPSVRLSVSRYIVKTFFNTTSDQ